MKFPGCIAGDPAGEEQTRNGRVFLEDPQGSDGFVRLQEGGEFTFQLVRVIGGHDLLLVESKDY